MYLAAVQALVMVFSHALIKQETCNGILVLANVLRTKNVSI